MDISAVVKTRLAALGYTVVEADGAAITYNIAKAEAALKVSTNQRMVPAGLLYVWADMAAGMFLLDKKTTGQLTGYDFTDPVKSVSEGDTSVTFALDTSKEAQFDALLTRLISPGEAILAAFRRVQW